MRLLPLLFVLFISGLRANEIHPASLSQITEDDMVAEVAVCLYIWESIAVREENPYANQSADLRSVLLKLPMGEALISAGRTLLDNDPRPVADVLLEWVPICKAYVSSVTAE